VSNEEKLEALVDYAVNHQFVPKNFGWIPEDRQALLRYWFIADNYKAVIFNHDFARALFGDTSQFLGYKTTDNSIEWKWSDNPKEFGFIITRLPAFQYHLQQAIILPTIEKQIDYFYGVVFGGKKK
jgi:hypothetical protein